MAYGRWKRARAGQALLQAALHYTPEGEMKGGLAKALTITLEYDPPTAASALGSGYRVLSWDTVPFALSCAARHLDSYEEALWTTGSGLDDRDTTCAMASGVAFGKARINSS